jgi:hypothetical protein
MILPKPRTRATSDEILVIAALTRCRLLPGSSDKRFIKSLAMKDSLTVGERKGMEMMRIKYRRQLTERVMGYLIGESEVEE